MYRGLSPCKAVHALGPADFAQVHCVQRTIGSPRGIQPLEVRNTISETQETRYQPIVFRSSSLFYIEMVFSGHGCLMKFVKVILKHSV